MADLSKEAVEQMTPEQLQELWLAKQEQLEEVKANASKGVNDYAERVVAFWEQYQDVKNNPQKILEIEDEKLQEMFLKKMYDWQTLEEFKETLKQDEPSQEEIIEQKVKKTIEQTRVNEKLSEVKAKLPEDLQSKFDEEFNELTDWKTLSSQNVDKYIKLTRNTIAEDQDDVQSLAKMYGVGGWSKTKSKSSKEKEIEERKKYAQSL